MEAVIRGCGTLQGFIDRLVAADKALAIFAIDDAVRAGANSKDIAKAREELAKGDEELGKLKYPEAIERYRNAWQHAVKK